MSAGHELSLAIKKVSHWYKAFPKADVCIGNHDRLASRKAFSGGVPSRWIKGYNDVLKTPNWNWVESISYDSVLYEHGEGGQAKAKAKNNMMSSVCGHTHTEAYTMWFVGKKFRVFGMQVGCGVDSSTYAAAYARNFKKQAIGCGVVIDGYCKDWDIFIPELNFGIEVKSDKKSLETNNIVIEIEMNGKPSALATSKSKWWVIYDGDKYNWFIIDNIKKCILDNKLKYVQFIGKGDSKSKKAYLIKKELLYKYKL